LPIAGFPFGGPCPSGTGSNKSNASNISSRLYLKHYGTALATNATGRSR
jgi:hypothetical protein